MESAPSLIDRGFLADIRASSRYHVYRMTQSRQRGSRRKQRHGEVGLRQWIASAALLCGMGYSALANPPKLAEQARLDLRADSQVQVLTNGFITAGDGSIQRMTWEPPAQQPGTYWAQWSIHRFAWREVGLQFTPVNSGQITLRLLGPWEEYTTGTIYRQEVFWDSGSAEGTSLTNGSFEAHSGGVPDDWVQPWASDPVVTNGPPSAHHGSVYVAVWHDNPLEATLTVTGGVPVKLSFHARALIPTNFVEMPRILSTNTPAHQTALNFMRGVNLAGHLEAPVGQDWGGACDKDDFVYVRNAGFDHVRLPIAWHHYTGPGPDFVLSNEILASAGSGLKYKVYVNLTSAPSSVALHACGELDPLPAPSSGFVGGSRLRHRLCFRIALRPLSESNQKADRRVQPQPTSPAPRACHAYPNHPRQPRIHQPPLSPQPQRLAVLSSAIQCPPGI